MGEVNICHRPVLIDYGQEDIYKVNKKDIPLNTVLNQYPKRMPNPAPIINFVSASF